MYSYAVVLLTMICGAIHAPWWCALVGGTALAIFCLAEQRHLKPQFAANDNLAVVNPASISAAATHAALGALAFPIGYFIRAIGP